MSIVQTNYGPIIGTTRKTSCGLEYNAFFGIPYAKQPEGENIFRDPQSCPPWKDNFTATFENQGAYQLSDDGKRVIGTDNCLVLNVYANKLINVKAPVFVWIHGGGFSSGSSSSALYRPDYFMRKDIVVVTINYRLSVVGFLSFKDPEIGIPGNAGLKDQSMALRWVKENIAHFGGDPENITLGGESHGGASVHFHMISPMSQGLFNRGIIQSGSIFCPSVTMPDDERYEFELARELGWNGEGGEKEAFKVISSTKIEELILSVSKLLKDQEKILFGSAYFTPFLPRVEAYKSEMCFLPKSIEEMAHEAWGNDIDLIIGGNKDEGLLFESSFKKCARLLENNFKLAIPNHLRRITPIDEQEEMAKKLQKIYFGQREPSFKFISKFIELTGDLHYWHSIHRALHQRKTKLGSGKTFHYFLSTSTDPDLAIYQNWRKICNISHLDGTAHADDLALMWKSIFSEKPKPKNSIYPTFVRFFESYANFIKFGNPNNEKLTETWTAIEDHDGVETNGFVCLKFFDEKVEKVANPFTEKLKVWDSIYENFV